MKFIVFAMGAFVSVFLSLFAYAEGFSPGAAEAIRSYGRATVSASGAVYDAELEARFSKAIL